MDQATPSNFYLTICLYVSFYFLFFTSTSQQLIPSDQELNETRRAQSASEQLDPFLVATRQAKATRQVKNIAKSRAKATVNTVRGYHSRQHSRQQHPRQHSRGISVSSSATSSSFAAGVDKSYQHQQQQNLFQHLRQHSRQKSQGTRRYPTVTTLFEIPGRYHFDDPSPSISSSLPTNNHNHNHSNSALNSFLNNSSVNNGGSNNIFDLSLNTNDNFTPSSHYQEYSEHHHTNNGYFWRTINHRNNNIHNSNNIVNSNYSYNYNTSSSPIAGLDFQFLQYHTARERTRLYHQHQLQQHYYTPPSIAADSPSSKKQQQPKQKKQQQHQPFSGIEQEQHQQQTIKATIEIQLQPQRYKPLQKRLRNFPRQNQNRYYHFYPEPIFRKKTAMTTSTNNTSSEPTVPSSMTSNPLPLDPDKSATHIQAPVAAKTMSSNSTTSSSTATTPISTIPVAEPTSMAGTSIQVQEQQQHQPKTTIGWAEGNQFTIEQRRSVTPNSAFPSQAGSGQAQFHQGLVHTQQQGAAITTIPSVSTIPPSNGNNNNNTILSHVHRTRTRYESKCHLEESVSPPTLLAHLRLLRLVQSLVIVDDEDLDFLFLIRSEERYLMFLDLLQQFQPPPNAMPLPPLDVALMWTVHMLAPFRYHEDLLRSYGPHLLNYAFPLERYVAAVDIEDPTTAHEAFRPCKEMWHQLYPEEAFDLNKEDTTRMFDIQCLWCGGTNVMDSSTYIKFRIDGMSIDCAGCGSQCSLETLSSKRLWNGIEAYRMDPSNLLAGSLLSPWVGTPDPVAAQREHHHLFFHPRIQFGLDQSSASLNCTWPKVIQAFQDLGPDQYYGIRPTTLARIMSSYMGLIEDRLSMDLVSGALRQRDFQKAMMVTGGLAWCQPHVLQRSLDRYKKFMLLARAESKQTDGSHSVSGPGLGAGQPGRHALVPTLDIDLAWHTHMLSPAHYRHFQLVHYGHVMNHDDTIQATSTMTKQDFIRTADLWQELYQERYSSQRTWKGRFVLTPQKLCAGVCFPPYGVYLIWKSWKSKRKAKKLNRTSQGGGPDSPKEEKKNRKEEKKEKTTRKMASEDATVVEAEGSEKPHRRFSTKKNIGGSGVVEADPDLQMEELAIAQEELEEEKIMEQEKEDLEEKDNSVVSQGYDTKGKGKVEDWNEYTADNKQEDSIIVSEGDKSIGATTDVTMNKNLTPALGLDGRLSNWNGDATGPDGQASCVSGACIMSPWNELQDMMPYIDLPPAQQQRELRRERT